MVDVQERRVRPAWRSARLFTVGRGTYPDGAPAWLPATLDEFVTNVGDSGYPCYFGRQALDRDDLFGVWVPRGQPVAALGADLREFLAATRPYPRRRMVLAAFFEPEPGERDHEWYGERFWSVLAGLNDQDEAPRPDDIPDSPRDPRWEFSFGGTAMFVFAAAPTHRERRSRRLGPGLVMLFQPRNVFHGIEGGTRGGTAARERIRSYLRDWDAAPPHPSMGEYGDESNFEWNQYFIGDHARPMFARCPVDPERDARLHDLFSAQARRTPDALALVAGTTTMDYRTLDRSSDALTAHLAAKGIGPEHLVGVMADRSAETVVSLLAVLKAGAAYVPVDPAYPEARRAYLLEDAGVDVVLTPRRLVASVPVGPRWLLLSDDTGTGTGRIPAPARNGGAALPDNLAYVIYTSGSTGEPKGVAVTHRQIVHSTAVQYAVERPYPEAFLLPVSFSFDASGVGLYWTLTTGGTLVLPTDAEHRDPERLRELISRYAVTHIDCAPSLYDVLLGAAGEGAAALRSLRLVQVGGEQCPPALVARHRDLLPECVFENNYGPTEATIWSTTNVLEPDSALPVDTVPIGYPIPGARVYLLDADLRPVPAGEPGEVYVGGAGVARGYHRRPALTATRFLPDPFTHHAGARMYRTGDIARQRPDGALEFLGRRDSQVKVRGFRIELGEIESCLRSHPAVAEAVVDVRPVLGEPTLIGYVRVRDGQPCPDAALVSHLLPVLPDHMVPRRYVRLDELPHTVSGKVDRHRLPDPGTAATATTATASAAAGQVRS